MSLPLEVELVVVVPGEAVHLVRGDRQQGLCVLLRVPGGGQVGAGGNQRPPSAGAAFTSRRRRCRSRAGNQLKSSQCQHLKSLDYVIG